MGYTLHSYTWSLIISVVTTNQYNDDIGMPPTKKSRTRSPPNITEGESHDCITITYLLLYHSPDTAPL